MASDVSDMRDTNVYAYIALHTHTLKQKHICGFLSNEEKQTRIVSSLSEKRAGDEECNKHEHKKRSLYFTQYQSEGGLSDKQTFHRMHSAYAEITALYGGHG